MIDDYFAKEHDQIQGWLFGWLYGLRPIVSHQTKACAWDALRGGLCKVFTRVSMKTTENSERQGRQARPVIEPDTSRLPVLEHKTAQPLVGPKAYCFNIHALPGIRNRDFSWNSQLPQPLHRLIGHQMQETRNNSFRSKTRNGILRQAKTGKHESW